MEEAEEQGFLEDVDTLQTPEEHAENLAILNDQKDQRTRWLMLCFAMLCFALFSCSDGDGNGVQPVL